VAAPFTGHVQELVPTPADAYYNDEKNARDQACGFSQGFGYLGLGHDSRFGAIVKRKACPVLSRPGR